LPALLLRLPYDRVSVGCGGLQEQIPHQGLDPQCTLLVLPTAHALADSSRSDYCKDQNAFSLNNTGAEYGVDLAKRPVGDEEAKKCIDVRFSMYSKWINWPILSKATVVMIDDVSNVEAACLN
jgi:hypothetical protein